MGTTVSAKFLKGDSTPAEKLSDAIWLLIEPKDSIGTIKVADKDRSQARHVLSFASDAYRFERYDHPGTDWAQGIHVYASVGDKPYVEGGALIGEGEDWWFGTYIKPNGHIRFERGEKLDPVNHCDEMQAKLREKGVDLERQKSICHFEEERAREHWNTIEKHKWGAFYGYSFQVYVAHVRDLAKQYCDLINNPDTEDALKKRAKSIEDAVDYRKFVAPVKREAREQAAKESVEAKTDTPDFAKPEEPSPAETRVLMVQYVDRAGLLTGEKFDLFKLPAGNGIQAYRKVRNNGVKPLPGIWYEWDPMDPRMLAEIVLFAEQDRAFGGGFSLSELDQ